MKRVLLVNVDESNLPGTDPNAFALRHFPQKVLDAERESDLVIVIGHEEGMIAKNRTGPCKRFPLADLGRILLG